MNNSENFIIENGVLKNTRDIIRECLYQVV